MRIAFITPSLHTLGKSWMRDPQMVKLAAPALSGFLWDNGFTDLRQYDFEVEVFELEKNEPGLLDLRVFFDDADVDEFLQDDNPDIRFHTELIVDTLGIEEAKLFVMSCSSVLELYADMHCAGNMCLCMAKVLRERYPDSHSFVGGLHISPTTRQAEEYKEMLRRCSALSFTAEGEGQYTLLDVIEHVSGGMPIEDAYPGIEKINEGYFLSQRTARTESIAKTFGYRRERDLDEITPTVEYSGRHNRNDLQNPSLHNTPWFDPRNMAKRSYSGQQLLDMYHLGPEWRQRLGAYADDQVVLAPMVFLEGCNAHCAFCGYSTSKMARRNIPDVIDGMKRIRETLGIKHFFFYNTNINGYFKYADAFCDELIKAKLDVQWTDCANLWALTPELMDKLAESGCIRLTYGVECPSPKILKYIHKGIEIEKIHERLQYMHSRGIWNHVLLITGLPYETEEDTKNFVQFLEDSNDYVHGYSISSFYLIRTSLFGAFPERYGLEILGDDLLEDQGFNEINGLKWPEKKKQIVWSTQVITETIERLKGDPKYCSGAVDAELIFWLYDRLGRDNKADIVRAYEEAYIGLPSHAKAYERPMRELLQNPPPDLRAAMDKLSWRPDVDALHVRRDKWTLNLPVRGEEDTATIVFRCHEFGDSPELTAGRNIGANLGGSLAFADKLELLTAEESPFNQALERVGWTITKRGLHHAHNGVGFRISNGDLEADIFVGRLMENERVAHKQGTLGFSYTERDKQTKAWNDDTTRFLLRMGKFLLKALVTEHGANALHSSAPSRDDLAEFTAILIAHLEAPIAEELDAAPLHRYFIEKGQRHGDKFSRVAAPNAASTHGEEPPPPGP